MPWNVLIVVSLLCTAPTKCREQSEDDQSPVIEDSSGSGDEDRVTDGSGDASSTKHPSVSPHSNYKSSLPTDMPTTPIYGHKMCYIVYRYIIDEISLMNRTLQYLLTTDMNGIPNDQHTTCIMKDLTLDQKDFNFHINIKGCVSDSGGIVKLSFNNRDGEYCYVSNSDDLNEWMYCYFSGNSQNVGNTFGECPCRDCFRYTGKTSTQSSTTSTIRSSTSRSTTMTISTDKVVSTTNASKTTTKMDPNTEDHGKSDQHHGKIMDISWNFVEEEKITDSDNACSGVSFHVVAVVGCISFLVGLAATALLIWIFHLKRTSGLCFREPEKAPQRMTSEKRTKMVPKEVVYEKVLAKHLTLDRKDPPSSENKVYFTNESTHKYPVNESTEMYEDITQEQTSKNVYTSITTSGINPSAPPIEEHVYKDLDLVKPISRDKNEYQLKEIGEKDKMYSNNLTVGDESEAEVFDHGRESTVSGHDYFTLQNENFRNSVQTYMQGRDGYEEDDENVENYYFVLEKK